MNCVINYFSLSCVIFILNFYRSEGHTVGGSLLFSSEAFSRLLGLRSADVSGPWPDGGEPKTCGLLMGFPDGRVFGLLLHAERSRERCEAHLVCDLGQPVAAISCWQPGLPGNKDWELLVVGSRCKVLSSHGASWLEAWAPGVLEEPQELCTDGPVVHWLHEGVPWEARLAVGRGSGEGQEPASLRIQAGPLPLGRALSIQWISSSVLSELWPQHGSDAQLSQDAGLLILDGCGGVRLVCPLPARQPSLKGLRPHPVIQARNDLLLVQAALQQLRKVRHNALPVTVERNVEDGRLVATFPDASSAPNWIHAVGFDVGDRTICHSVLGPPSGIQGPREFLN